MLVSVTLPTLFFSFNILDLLPLHINFINQFVDICKITCWVLIRIAWIYRSSWEELTSRQYWVFLSINMDFLLLFSCQVVSDSVTPWTAAPQASLSFTISQSLLKFMIIESVMPSNHLILCCPLLLPSVFPSIRVFFQWVSSSNQVAKVLALQHQSFQWVFRVDFL